MKQRPGQIYFTLQLLVIFSMVVFTASCTKDRPKCWDCTFGYVNGHKPADREVCGTLPTEFTDDQGNPLQSNCVEK